MSQRRLTCGSPNKQRTQGSPHIAPPRSHGNHSSSVLSLPYQGFSLEPSGVTRWPMRLRGMWFTPSSTSLSPMWDQSVRHRAIDSSELRLTTDREGRQVGQHRSHIVAAVSSACLIARAAASGSQGRIVSSLSPGRPRADVGLSAVWSDLSAVSTTDQVGVF